MAEYNDGVFVRYEFFLTEAGVERFTGWLDEALRAFQMADGFVDIKRLTAVDDPKRCVMQARVATEKGIWRWAMSPEHIRLLESLDGYHVRPWRTETFKVSSVSAS